jgi:hypothetical protein
MPRNAADGLRDVGDMRVRCLRGAVARASWQALYVAPVPSGLQPRSVV